jgi:pantothenate kinase
MAGTGAAVTTLSWPGDFADLRARAAALLLARDRAILGIAGAPGSGKSTLAAELLASLEAEFPGQVAVVGMDAFHLAQRVVERHGLALVKGAPDTFDANGYVSLLGRLRSSATTVYAPEFHREIEDSIAGQVEIDPQVRLVLTEGNYLLLPEPPWDQVRPMLDEAWFLEVDDTIRQQRLAARHQLFGIAPESAVAKTLGSDERNAQLINRAQTTVDVRIRV